ncbi:MAG TPA: sulfatase [Gemmataceae bacterium]|jgi:arylsulfatase A-like enzyme|nr:sulfatase [Gemmataceae bacterium]
MNNNRRRFTCSALLLLSGLTVLLAKGTTARAEQPPAKSNQRLNVVFILADDLGAHDLGCYGSTFYESPNLDRLARQGMRFTQAYAACPVCSPTRAALMTGKYPPRTGITDFIGGNRKGRRLPADYAHQLALDEVTLAEAFKSAGYVTGMAGKWHLGGEGFGPEKQGFDDAVSADTRGWNGQVDRGERVTQFALGFLEKNRAKPFFLYLPHNLPHIPLLATDAMTEKYKKKAAALPAVEEAKRFRSEGQSKDRRVQDHPVYAAMVEDLDRSVGSVLSKLDQLGLTEHTLVVFTSDNGGLSTAEGSPTSNAPLRAGKGWLYEGGIREPLIVRWPGTVKPGSSSDVPVITTDFYPTLLEAAGLKLMPEQHRDGASLVSVLRGERASKGLADRPLLWHYPHYSNQGGGPAGAVRLGDWKFIEFYEDGHVELFSLRNDPGERKNLAGADHLRLLAMSDMLTNWRAAVGARMPKPNPNFKQSPAGK